MSEDLCWMDGWRMASLIRERTVSPVEAVQAVLDQLERANPKINAFVTVLAEESLKEAVLAEQRVMTAPKESLGALHGVPITIKDLTDTKGVRTTYGSLEFRDHVPQTDSKTWARIKKSGAIMVGKTTTPEFGLLGVTESKLTGVTNNPWRTTHTSGGSSGGAAAAVAAGIAPLAWGSDGGGSIRVPAACCGVVGYKASMGRIPNDAPWDSVGTDGPLARSVLDVALLLSVTAGPHPYDPLSLPAPTENYYSALLNGTSLAGLRVAYSPDFGTATVDREVSTVVDAALTQMKDLGALVDQVSIELPDPIDYFQAFWSPVFAAELGEDMLSGKVSRENVHPVTWETASKGMMTSAVDYYRTGSEIRGQISAGFASAFERYDLVVTPTMPVTAFPHAGEAAGNTQVNGVPVSHPAIDFHRLTEPASHAGLPSITVPCGFSPSHMPVGLQIIGPQHGDLAVLKAAAAYEAANPWRHMRPEL